MKILFGIAVALLSSVTALGRTCPVESGFLGSRYSMDRFHAREAIRTIHKLDELPLPIRNQLDTYLKSKLGNAFGKLKFDSGEWIDLEKIKRISPKDYNWNSPMGTYDLAFRFSYPEKGLTTYFTKIVLDDDGSVREDINLPDFAKNPEKAAIISCQEAVTIALSQGFPKEAIHVQFEYALERKSFVWVVTDGTGTEPDDSLILLPGTTYRKMDIDANTGTVLKVYKQTITV